MRLITAIKIEGFRSIRSAEITDLADLTSFAGLNNSGKSNVLRALNAFFNEQTNPEAFVDVDADYFRPDLHKKKRKRIRISVTFELPQNFNFRKGLESVKTLLADNLFTISKEWTRDILMPTVSLNENILGAEDSQKIIQFLQLIKYRYVPNRILPTELIRNEHQSLRDVLVRRLANSAKADIQAFEAIRDTSARMIESLAKRFDEACPEQGTVSLATPKSWGDLAFAFGYRLARNGIEVSDAEQGSGIQSLLMLETLYLIDRDYFQQFGWRQAAIWGVEEPESSLHTSLEARVADYLANIAADANSRLQVFCTTHSDLVVQYSSRTVVVKQTNGESRFQAITDPREALEQLSNTGVARWVHPILYWPLDTIVLVEGDFDRRFLEEGFRFFKPNRKIHVCDLPALDEDAGGGGVERLKQYIKESAKAIRTRRGGASVIVVLDWDAAAKENAFRNLVKDSRNYKVLVWPEASANPNAGKSFKGIERFHCDRVIDVAIEREAPIGQRTKGSRKGQYLVEAGDYESAKQVLNRIVCEGLQQSDFVHAESFLKKILSAGDAA